MIVSICRDRLALAAELGDSTQADVVQQVSPHRRTGRRAVIVAVGSAAARWACNWRRPTARQLLCGHLPSTIAVDPNVIHYSSCGSRAVSTLRRRVPHSARPHPRAGQGSAADRPPLCAGDVAEAFDTVVDRGGMKVIVNMDGELARADRLPAGTGLSTTTCRAMAFDRQGNVLAEARRSAASAAPAWPRCTRRWWDAACVLRR